MGLREYEMVSILSKTLMLLSGHLSRHTRLAQCVIARALCLARSHQTHPLTPLTPVLPTSRRVPLCLLSHALCLTPRMVAPDPPHVVRPLTSHMSYKGIELNEWYLTED